MALLKITHSGIQKVEEKQPKPIVLYPNPILRKIMPDFDFSKRNDAVEIANDLILALQQQENGLAISAPQIGIEEKVFVMGVDNHLIAYFNPIITQLGVETNRLEEGCLSFPGLHFKVERPRNISLAYQDYTGKHHVVEFGGITARIAQHEVEHLYGVLFIDKVGKITLSMAKERQRKYLKALERKK